MIFSTTFARFIALALVGTSLATPVNLEPRGNRIVFGYRTVSKAEADSIRKAKTAVYDGKLASGGKQTGEGIYLTSSLGEWPASHADDEYCIFTADEDEVKAANKAWIPLDVEWTEDAVAKSITGLDSKWKAKEVLRLSLVKGKKYYQITIPKGLIGTNWLNIKHTKGDLSLEVTCKPAKEYPDAELPDHPDNKKVDWKAGPFASNIKGVPQ